MIWNQGLLVVLNMMIVVLLNLLVLDDVVVDGVPASAVGHMHSDTQNP